MEERFIRRNTKAAWQNLNMIKMKLKLQLEFSVCFLCRAAEHFLWLILGRIGTIIDIGSASTPITVEEQRVVSILSTLQPRKSPGPDGLESCKSERVLGPIRWDGGSGLGMSLEHEKRQTLFLSLKKLMSRIWRISDLWHSPRFTVSAWRGC